MDCDVDPFDDLQDYTRNVNGSSKFQPKKKFQPARKPLAAASILKPHSQTFPDTVQAGSGLIKLETLKLSNNKDTGSCIPPAEKSLGLTCDVFNGLEDHDNFPSEATALGPPDPFEVNESEKDSDPVFHQDDVLDLSSFGFTNLLVGNDAMKYDSDHERSHQDTETVGKSLQSGSQQSKFLDGNDDEVFDHTESSGEQPSTSPAEEENSIEAECQVQTEENMETAPSPRKHGANEGPSVRKRKKPNEAASISSQKPKKFSHSSRRRKVNRALLETPEEEIDYQNISLRDIILLAEHKEKQMKKEEAAGMQENGDGHATYEYFNYQTYMNKPRTIRWSKQDTDLFYEGLQQFGTDLSLIQQLFPGLTRQQIKLKYKKEERQHPMRLQQALSSRSKDHSYYDKLIERLSQVAADLNQNGDIEESLGPDPHAFDEEAQEEEQGAENEIAESASAHEQEEQEQEDDDYYPYTSL